MGDRFDLSLQLLSDPDLELGEAYPGIEDSDARGETPVPGTFIVDADGVVRYEHVGENAADRTAPATLGPPSGTTTAGGRTGSTR
jgi:peroxiredoxin